MDNDVKKLLEELLEESKTYENAPFDNDDLNLANDIEEIVKNESIAKGAYTVVLTSLIYKIINPKQDIRYYKKKMENGYAGRSFDTQYITPFLQENNFLGAMSESGWLTRTLETDYPYLRNYNASIKKVKPYFLNILNTIEEDDVSTEYLKRLVSYMMFLSVKNRDYSNSFKINDYIDTEKIITINEIIEIFKKHWNYKYSVRGSSILPVVAYHSIYEIMVNELKRYNNCVVNSLNSHYSSDKSSGAMGDIEIVNKKTRQKFEVLEIKHMKPIDLQIVHNSFLKFNSSNISRYLILSTAGIKTNDKEKVSKMINAIQNETGIEIIVRDIYNHLSIILETLSNPLLVIKKYAQEIKDNKEIPLEIEKVWNLIILNKKAKAL